MHGWENEVLTTVLYSSFQSISHSWEEATQIDHIFQTLWYLGGSVTHPYVSTDVAVLGQGG